MSIKSDIFNDRDAESFSVCFLISTVIHLLVFSVLGIRQFSEPLTENVSPPAVSRPLDAQLLIVRPRLTVSIGTDENVGRILAGNTKAEKARVFSQAKVENLSVSSVDPTVKENKRGTVTDETRKAELSSDVGSYLGIPTTPGYLILMLKISDQGEVVAIEVAHTTLVPQVTWLIQKRFANARFKPAVRSGQNVEDTILIKIDID